MKIFYPNLNSKQYGIIMNYYGISHVVLVFFTRTLSNSFEAFLFLILIYLININLSIIINKKNSVSTKCYLMLTSSLIGFICALGLFNRPTFPAFAIVPIIYWFLNIIPIINHFHLLLSQIISFIIGTFILTSSLCILFDSYYYNHGFSFIIDLKNHLIICPLNFILYNIDSTNLDKHGLHPPWLHFIVNANILYGPLHLCIVLWSLFYILNIKQFRQTIIDRVLKIFHRKSNEGKFIS
jgi:phosphatidylinositol glycan class Z